MRKLGETIDLIAAGRKKNKKGHDKRESFRKDVDQIQNMKERPSLFKKTEETGIDEDELERRRQALFHKETAGRSETIEKKEKVEPVVEKTETMEKAEIKEEKKPLKVKEAVPEEPIIKEESPVKEEKKEKEEPVPIREPHWQKKEAEKTEKKDEKKEPIEDNEKEKQAEVKETEEEKKPESVPEIEEEKIKPETIVKKEVKTKKEEKKKVIEKKEEKPIAEKNKEEKKETGKTETIEKKKRFSFGHKHKKIGERKEIKIPTYDIKTESSAYNFLKQDDDFRSKCISTKIDDLYKLIIKRKVIRIDEASVILKINLKELEKWARILEDNKLIEIYYPLFGKVKLHIPGIRVR